MVVPSRFSAVNRCRRRAAISASTFPVGSSATSSSGWLMTARAIATRCCSPPDKRRRARAGAVGEPDPGEHFPHRSFELGIAPARRSASGKRDIVERRKMADQAEVLEDHADPASIVGQGCRAARRSGPARTAGSDPRSVGEQGREAAAVTSCPHRTGRSGNRIRPWPAGNRGREGPRRPCRSANQRCRIRRSPTEARPSLSGSFLHALAALPMAAHSCLPFENDGRALRMILTCPSCGTQYVVKDGAIPPTGRQVRCKACQHSWREFPPPPKNQCGTRPRSSETATNAWSKPGLRPEADRAGSAEQFAAVDDASRRIRGRAA